MSYATKQFVAVVVLSATALVARAEDKPARPTSADRANIELPTNDRGRDLQKLLDQRNLAGEGRQIACRILAELAFDRELARLATEDEMLAEDRDERMALADEARQQRVELKRQLQSEMESLRNLDGPKSEIERRIVLIIRAYRGPLKASQEREESLRQEIEEIDRQRAELYRIRTRLELQRRLQVASRGRLQPRLPLLPAARPTTITAPSNEPGENLSDALESIEKY
jgi:hypothetical protein